MEDRMRELAKEFDYCGQDRGDVYVACMPEDIIVVPAESTMSLLQIVLTAIRVEGNTDKLELARKIARAHLKMGAGT